MPMGNMKEPPEETATYEWGVESPLQAELLQGLLDKAGDPEVHMREWIRDGAPLGLGARRDLSKVCSGLRTAQWHICLQRSGDGSIEG